MELQAQLDKAMATERELKEELARRPTDVWMLEAQIEERDERIVRLEKMVTEMKSRVAEKDAKVHQLVYCIVALMAVVIDLGLIMFMK